MKKKKPSKYKFRKQIVVGKTPDGKKIVKDIKSNDWDTFAAAVSKAKVLAKSSDSYIDNNLTFGAAFALWNAQVLSSPSISAGRRTLLSSMYNAHIADVLQDELVASITKADIQRLINGAHSVRNQPLSKYTYSLILHIIRSVYNFLIDEEIVKNNPCVGVRTNFGAVTKRNAATLEQEVIIRKVASTHRYGTWVMLMLDCGLRPSEAAALQTKNINFANKTAYICEALDFSTKPPKAKAPKTKAGIRTVPVPPSVITLLEKNKDCQYAVGDDMKFMTKRSVTSRWDVFIRACVKEGLDLSENHITAYSMRHTYCTNLCRLIDNPKIIQYLMGHKTVSMTLNIYAEVQEKEDIATLVADGTLNQLSNRGTAGEFPSDS